MTNYIFFDTETNSGRGLADILSINALFCSPDFKIIEEFFIVKKIPKFKIFLSQKIYKKYRGPKVSFT